MALAKKGQNSRGTAPLNCSFKLKRVSELGACHM